MTDVLDHLRAANPVDPLDAADGVAPLPARQPTRKTPTPRRRPLAAGAAITVLVSGIGLIGLPAGQGSRKVDVAAAAARALSPNGAILHVITRTTFPEPDGTSLTSESELWLDPDGQHGRSRITRSDGTVLADTALPGEPGLFDDVVDARAMIRDRSLVPAGQETLDGRRVQRFTGHRVQRSGQEGETTWYLDAETYEPVRTVSTVHDVAPHPRRGSLIVDYVRFERLDDNAANRELMTPPQSIMPGTSPKP